MNLKLLLCLALGLSDGLSGCSTAAQHPAAMVPADAGLPYQKINGFSYETKPVWLGSRGLFYWFVSNELKHIYYEPCSGHFDIDPLKVSKSELIFKITGSYGTPIDLRTGKFVAASDVVGKKYAAKLKKDHIVGIFETK
jgi:hypothetical protein